MPDLSKRFERFVNKLDLPLDVEQKIESAQEIIEKELKVGIEEFSASPNGGGMRITPKFILQGSKVYGTLNNPCYMPPQQVDVDLGVHVPVSFHENSEEPVVAALEYFGLVDSILLSVANKNGWRLDGTKQTCTRVVINDQIHIDVPLYSMPNQDFARFNKAIEAKRLDKSLSVEDMRLANQLDWDDFDFKRVLLCMRQGFWKPSDPRKMAKRFRDEVLKNGDQLRKVWRIIKAWRDFVWKTGGPSSCYLMIGALGTFKKAFLRDDLALLSALKAFEAASTMQVMTTEGEDLKENQNEDDLRFLEEKAKQFVLDLTNAINLQVDNGEAELIVSRHLGDRFQAPGHNPGGSGKTMSQEEKTRLMQSHHQKNPVGSPHFIKLEK